MDRASKISISGVYIISAWFILFAIFKIISIEELVTFGSVMSSIIRLVLNIMVAGGILCVFEWRLCKELYLLILPIAVYEVLHYIPESIGNFLAIPCYVAVLYVSTHSVVSFWKNVNEICIEKRYSQRMIIKCRQCTELAVILFAICIVLSIILGTVSDRLTGVFLVLYFAYTIGIGVIFAASVTGYIKRMHKAFEAEEQAEV